MWDGQPSGEAGGAPCREVEAAHADRGGFSICWFFCYSWTLTGMLINHGTHLSSPSLTTQKENCQSTTGQIRWPQPILSRSYWEMEGPWRTLEKGTSTSVFPGCLRAGCYVSYGQQPLWRTGHVTADWALVVARGTVGLVIRWAQDGCVLAVREMRDVQPWCDAGGPLCKEARADHGYMGLDTTSVDSCVYLSLSPWLE